jgi:hypothetical protein
MITGWVVDQEEQDIEFLGTELEILVTQSCSSTASINLEIDGLDHISQRDLPGSTIARLSIGNFC